MGTKTTWGAQPFTVKATDQTTFIVTVCGRDRWALECLMAAGATGCTPIDTPGPRWSGYVFNLRQLGIEIETVTEPHSGPFSGTHARYVLRSVVSASDRRVVA